MSILTYKFILVINATTKLLPTIYVVKIEVCSICFREKIASVPSERGNYSTEKVSLINGSDIYNCGIVFENIQTEQQN